MGDEDVTEAEVNAVRMYLRGHWKHDIDMKLDRNHGPMSDNSIRSHIAAGRRRMELRKVMAEELAQRPKIDPGPYSPRVESEAFRALSKAEREDG